MKKKEMKLLVATLVECGKGLAYASQMPKGSKEREAGTRILNEQIDGALKQLELLCEDVDYKKAAEILKEVIEA